MVYLCLCQNQLCEEMSEYRPQQIALRFLSSEEPDNISCCEIIPPTCVTGVIEENTCSPLSLHMHRGCFDDIHSSIVLLSPPCSSSIYFATDRLGHV